MTTSEKSRFNPREFLRVMLPIISWLPRYQYAWLRTDIMAGLAVWAMTVPQALAYAGIAGVPPVYGLYTVPLAMVAYAVFWAFTFALVLSIWSRQRRVSRDLELFREQLDTRKGRDGESGLGV